MRKPFVWFKENTLFLVTLFLLAFIPLYPKLPLIDVAHVWVYIRLEDFVVLFVLIYWLVMAIRNKSMLRTPLTVPILVFWLIGAVSTLHATLLIFPLLANVFPNIALLSFLRRIEYMSLFFIAYSAMRKQRFFSYFVAALTLTLMLVIVYGLGQKFLGFPAFLTMNEEFAKGVAIQLSPLSRLSSTFGGHYDLAAYLVLVTPIIISLIFGYQNFFLRIIFLGVAILGTVVLFMTVSRISFFAFCVAVGTVLFLQKKKIILFSLPILLVITIFLLSFSPSLTGRFGRTVKEIDILVDARTGTAIGQAKEVPNTFFENKVVKQQYYLSIQGASASPSASLVVPYTLLPPKVVIYVQPNVPTGEDLPQGTGYINLSLSPITKRLGEFFYEHKPDPKVNITEFTIINGDYLIKKALAYDLSFTTRFQAEWPHALVAFKRNILLGSGYGSVSLAVDNSYLRTLAEVGVLGFASFLAIFLTLVLYIKKILPSINSRPIKSFILGFAGGMVGLAINALFIDVFEASKVAFVIWILVGTVLALLSLHQNISFDFYRELRKIATSTPAIIVYLFIATILLFSPLTRNYFVGDDFTWFRWVAECANQNTTIKSCPLNLSAIFGYFTNAEGFFYRPGAKTYFLLMYSIFWLNQTVYHLVSLFLHFLVTALVYLLAKKIFRNTLLSALSGFLFLTLSGYSEAVFWISATGFLFTAVFSLASLLMFITWLEKKKLVYFMATLGFFVLSLMFHELGLVTPLFYLLYLWTYAEVIPLKNLLKNAYYQILFLPIPVYLLIRAAVNSHWLSGDYNYNLLKLPFNILGNAIGYFSLAILGPLSSPFYQALRNIWKEHTLLALITTISLLLITVIFSRKFRRLIPKNDLKIIRFGVFFFVIALLPFLGLGNIASRYSYLSSVGVLFLFMLFVNKFYKFLLTIGRDLALVSTVLLVCVFSLSHVVQQQQNQSDWYEAGETVRRFIVSVNSVYSEGWARESLEFHFANVPIRRGQAWVFPVGLPDALWFVFRNPNLGVYTWATARQAFTAAQADPQTKKAFVFKESGEVVEVTKSPLVVQ